MDSYVNILFVMVAPRAQQASNDMLIKDPQAKNENKTTSIPSDLCVPPVASTEAMPPGLPADTHSDGSLGLSDSPGKEDRKRVRWSTPRKSSSQHPGGPSPRTSRAASRASPRSAAEGPPDRGRSPRRRFRFDATPWPDVAATLRRIMIDRSEPIGPAFARGVALQLHADREHMEMLKAAIGGLFLSLSPSLSRGSSRWLTLPSRRSRTRTPPNAS